MANGSAKRKTAEIIRHPQAQEHISISPANFAETVVRVVGNAPYVMNKMSAENRKKMMDKQLKGGRAKKGEMRQPKDFEKIYQGCMHISREGWYGQPASAYRAALVSACRLVGFKMTLAKLSVFVIPDGFDADDGQPLVRINGKPKRRDMAVKLANGGTDIIPRAFFDEWHCDLRLRWDADQFSATDVINLLSRVGVQVGVGAGRPDSKNSCGMGWGTFDIEQKKNGK